MPLGELHAGPELSAITRPVGTPNLVEADVFPPARAQAPDPSIFLPYTTEDIAFEEEYEEYLSDLGMGDDTSSEGLFNGTSAWHRLPHIGSEIADGISDSESIASIGELGDEAKFDPGLDSDRESIDENRNNWEVRRFAPFFMFRMMNLVFCYFHLAHESEDHGRIAKIPCWNTQKI